MFIKILCLLVFTAKCVVSQDRLVIGALFYQDEAEDLTASLNLGASRYNFSVSVKEISQRGAILEINDHVCALAQESVIGIIDGLGGRASEHIQALCDILELPHVLIQHNDLYAEDWSVLNLYPSPEAYNMVLESLITMKDWNNFTILYQKGHAMTRVSELIKMGNETDRFTITVRELSGDDYRDVLTNAKENGYYNFVVDCPSRNLEQLLSHAQQVGLMADEHSYIFVSPDLFTVDLSRYRYGGVNMTGLRLVRLEDSEAIWEFASKFNEETGKYIEAENIKTKVLLAYDAVQVFNEGVLKTINIQPESLTCDDYQAWSHGSTLLNFMKTNAIEGVTRSLIFDGMGQRSNVIFDILELTPSGNQSIGEWSSNELTISRPFVPREIIDDSLMRNKTFKVLISTTAAPHAYLRASKEKLVGNDRYEGFAVDLMEKLSQMLGFHYELEEENNYGKFDESQRVYIAGMTYKLIEDRADFAICDFTITELRRTYIDFSTPFMTLGIAILFKEPSKQPPAMFSFMAVFSNEVWYYMVFVQMGIGVIMIFVGRMSHKEWQNPVPCVESPEELSNQFSLANSIWLIIGSVMQQGSEIAPIALAPRLITSVWWFFTMVMVASYVGTLVAFLTVEKNVLPFQTAEELYHQKTIMYGAKESGSTIEFFKQSNNPTYQAMYKKMSNNGWLAGNNDIGVQRAENSTYAFFIESSALEYYVERHCDLMQIGNKLDSKSYGIGMKKGSPYKKDIDDALLLLKESGEIQRLKDLWWKEKRGGGKCGKNTKEEQKELGMRNMCGAFVVLGGGSLIGIIVSLLDMLWGVFKRSVKYKTSFKYELVEELKFALKFSGDIKPVKRPSKSDEGSEEALAKEAEDELKDELGSLRSQCTFRSRKSSSSHKSHHSHSSRHSNMSIAFARRREYT